MGVQLLVIGIGNSINSTELTSIAGDKLMFMWQVISKNLYLKDLYDLCHKEYVKVREQPESICKGKADVGFIVDSSGSLANEYSKEKEFVNQMIHKLQLSPSGTHSALVLFSYSADLKIKFSDYQNVKDFQRAVQALPLMKSTTRIDKALKLAYNDMFNAANGMRPNVPKILVLLTDGEQTHDHDAILPSEAVKPFHKAGIKVIVIGIGSGVKQDELLTIVKSPEDLYFAETFDELKSDSFVKNITDATCKATVPKCDVNVDIGFIVDSSGSLHTEYHKEKTFVKLLADSFQISKTGSRGSIITFSYNAELSVKLSDHDTKEGFNEATDNLPFFGYTTRIDKALRMAQEQLFLDENGARPNKPKLLVLLTDGTQTPYPDAEDPAKISEKLRNMGIKVVVIGIGASVNQTELVNIAGNKTNTYVATNFDSLQSETFVQDVSKTACDIVKHFPKPAKLIERCNAQVDLGFLIDTSVTSKTDLLSQKKYIKRIVEGFAISESGARAGLVLFADRATLNIKLSDHYSVASFIKAVNRIPLKNSLNPVRFGGALNVAYTQLFNEKNGGRRNVPQLIIVLSAGKQDASGLSLSKQVSAIHEAGIKVIVLGIGSAVNRDQIATIGKVPENIFFAKDFKELTSDEFIRNTSTRACLNAVRRCTSRIDVGFIVDSSGSLMTEYHKEKEFVKLVAETFQISKSGTRGGVILFSYHAKHSIKLSDHGSTAEFNAAVDNLPLMRSTTRIDKALTLAQNELYTEKNGGRAGVPKILILLTDGSQTLSEDAKDPSRLAKIIRDKGVKLVVVGIGAAVNQTELAEISGDRSNLFMTGTFDKLISPNFIRNISEIGCKEPKITENRCTASIDVGFIVDSSGSLRSEYSKEKDFVSQVVEGFGISRSGTKAGLVLFSRNAELCVKFDQFNNVADFQNAVDNLPLMGMTTRIDKALKVAYDQLFSTENGMRPKTPKVVILLTDGEQTQDADAIAPSLAVMPFHEAGIKVMVVGIGSGVKPAELASIVKSPSNLYFAKDFDQLKSKKFVEDIIDDSCKNLMATCSSIADIAFVVDSSGSLRYEFDKEKEFVQLLTATFDIRPEASRVGVVTFSYNAEVSIKYTDYNVKDKLIKAIRNLPLFGYTTRIDKGLQLAKEQLISKSVRERPNVPKFLILLTDGTQTQDKDAFDPVKIAEELRSMGVELFVIGIGSAINSTELNEIAGDKMNVYVATNFEELRSQGFVQKMAERTCRETPKAMCKGTADVGFIVDSSGSVTNEYGKEKDFVSQMIQQLQLSSNGTHSALVLFSDSAALKIKFSDYQNVRDFQRAVQELPLMGSTTRIDKALKLAYNDMFNAANGMRPNVPKILVLLTDGEQTRRHDSISPSEAVKPFHKAGIKVVVIGIGSDVKRDELLTIVKYPKDLYFAETFDELKSDSFVKNITDATCKATVQKCEADVDIGFVVDSSGSLRSEYHKEKKFVKLLADSFQISITGSRGSVITFSYNAELSVKLSDHHTREEFNKAVAKLPFFGYTTRIDKALHMAKHQLFKEANGARPNKPKLLVLLTDGSQTPYPDVEDPAKLSEELRKMGIKVIVIGIGASINRTELVNIAGNKTNAYVATNFDTLQSEAFVQTIASNTCNLVKRIPKPVKICNAEVDIGFIVDVSTSLLDLSSYKQYIKNIAQGFGISKAGTRAGIVSYAAKATLDIKLSDHTSADSFIKAVNKINLKSSSGSTNIDEAFNLAYTKLFSKKNGARNHVPQLIVMLTSGKYDQNRNNLSTSKNVSAIHEAGIKVIVLATGSAVNRKQITAIGKIPENIFFVKNLTELISEKFIRKTGTRACLNTVRSCKSRMDVGFIVDSSGSLTTEYHKQKKFVKQLAESFQISQSGTRAGVILFSYHAEHRIKLLDHDSTSTFNKAVDDLPLMRSTTRIDKALLLVQKGLFTKKNGGREGVPKLLILLTDGSQTPGDDAKDPAKLAEAIRKSGVKFVVVAMGAAVNKTELTEISGDPSNLHIADTFDQLISPDFIRNISEASCKPGFTFQGKADIIFLVDSSSSIGKNHIKELQLVASIAEKYNLSPTASQAAVILFSNLAQIAITFNGGNSLRTFKDTVLRLPLTGSYSRLDHGLGATKTLLSNSQYGARRSVPKIVYIITAGERRNKGIISSAGSSIVQWLRKHNIHVIIFGIGKTLGKNDFQSVTDNPSNVFTVDGFDKILTTEFVNRLVSYSCRILGTKVRSTLLPVPVRQVPKIIMEQTLPCTIERDVKLVQSLIDNGVSGDVLIRALSSSNILKNLDTFYPILTSVMDQLKPYRQASPFDSGMSTMGCHSYKVNNALDRVFTKPTKDGNDVIETALKLNATSFVDLLYATGINEELLRDGERFTLFVPSNDAFRSLSPSVGLNLRDACYLKKVLRHHIISRGAMLLTLSDNDRLESLEQNPIYFNRYGSVNIVGGSVVTKQDVMAQNGIIHLINGLILPPENSLYDVIELDNSLSVFRSAIKISGLNWFIRRSDPLTVFAPDDNAFASLPPGTLNSLYGNPREMQNVLKHHLVEGVLYSPALTSGHGYRLRPAYGRAITLKKRLDQIEINSDTVIKKKDISASNGVLHIVNKVLLP